MVKVYEPVYELVNNREENREERLRRHRTEYASNVRYAELLRDRDYWKALAIANQKVARDDGFWTGVVVTAGAFVLLAILALMAYPFA